MAATAEVELTVEDLSITFYGSEGWSHQFQWKQSLNDSEWTKVGGPIMGSNEVVSIPPPHGSNGFYTLEASYVEVEYSSDFSQPGPYGYSNAVYASTPDYRYKKYSQLYRSITPGFELDHCVESVSPFLYWLLPIPMNGLLRIPEKDADAPPSPLAIVVHGRSRELNSEQGLTYLCDQLASHGIIAASIDEYIFNAESWGLTNGKENDARAVLLLEHVKQFELWNETPGHPLEGKVDMQNVMLIGHSRGGEAVELAHYFHSLGTNNSPVGLNEELYFDGSDPYYNLGPYDGFELTALVALAPTEGSGVNGAPTPAVEGNYLLLQGSADEDVVQFTGYKVYEQANPIDLIDPQQSAAGFKSLVWIHGANHSHFNTLWPTYPSQLPVLDGDLQRKIAKYYITAFAHATLLADDEAIHVFQDNRVGDEYFLTQDDEGADIPVQRATQYQARERLFINHHQEDRAPQTLSSSAMGITGTNSWLSANLTETKFSSVAKNVTGSWDSGDEPDNYAAYWQPETDSEYTVRLDTPLDISPFNALSLNVAATDEEPIADLDFDITVTDAEGNSATFELSNFANLWGPTETEHSDYYLAISVMQTIYLPLDAIREANSAFDLTALKSISLEASSPTASAELYFDNLQLMK